MSLGFSDLMFSILIAFLGVLTGWAWRKASHVASKEESSANSNPQMEQAEVILAQLHDLAAGVAADVGEHNSQVEAINGQLTAENRNDTEVVVNAVSQLLAANSRMQHQLESAEAQLRRQAEEIESQTAAARTDALTGLANRRVFNDELADLSKQFHDEGTPFAVTILDIDHFKTFNDVHGHQLGDRVLQHAAKVSLDTVPNTDIVTRFGGEEFAIVHPATEVEEAIRRADAVRRALDDSRIHDDGNELHVTASVGVAQLLPGEDPADLIKRADVALYAAKEAGRNRTYWHTGKECRPVAEEQQRSPATEQPQPSPGAESPTRAVNLAPGRNAKLQTRLLDRPRFVARLSKSLAALADEASTPTVFLVCADKFEDTVDRHGGDTRERLLDTIATVLLAVAQENGIVATFDRRTFALLVLGYDSVQAMQMADRIRQVSLQCPLPTAAGSIQFTLSIGATRAVEDDNATRLVGRAETALESAVRAGGNNAFFHNGKWAETAETILSEATCKT